LNQERIELAWPPGNRVENRYRAIQQYFGINKRNRKSHLLDGSQEILGLGLKDFVLRTILRSGEPKNGPASRVEGAV
jgi:hypothetical protein